MSKQSCTRWGALVALGFFVAACGGGGARPSGGDGGSGDGAADSGPRCEAAEVLCGAECVDTQSDPSHCGACDDACGSGEVCNMGSCALSCGGQTPTECDGGCFDLDTSRQHCGACGNACGAGEVCVDGACTTSCPDGQIVCDGRCIDPNTDRAFCGASGDCAGDNAGSACTDGQVCDMGSCAASCSAPLTACDGGCVDTRNDPSNCGACGNACTPELDNTVTICLDGTCNTLLACQDGYGDCNRDITAPGSDGCETNLSNSEQNCGACGNRCDPGEACVDGACTPCPPGRPDGFVTGCSGTCVDLTQDPNNCLQCGNACSGDTPACVGSLGLLQAACMPNCSDYVPASGVAMSDCGTMGSPLCVDTQTDPNHCGACDNACGAGEICSDGTCVACAATEVACTGVCIDPQTNDTFCGASGDCSGANAGTTCTGGQSCQDGACVCPTGQVFCDGTCVDPDTNPRYCGASADCSGANAGTTCTGGQSCQDGTCACPTGWKYCPGFGGCIPSEITCM